MFSRKSFGTCSAGRGRVEILLPLRSPFRRQQRERPAPLQCFLTVTNPRLCRASIRVGGRRFRRQQGLFCGLLDLDEVASFALTTLDTQIVRASTNAVEM